jgi:hypothetical protein
LIRGHFIHPRSMHRNERSAQRSALKGVRSVCDEI